MVCRPHGPGAVAFGDGLCVNLLLLFSFGTTLHTWKQVGFMDREHRYYCGLMDRGVARVSFLTYGEHDKDLEQEISPISVLPKRVVGHLLLYSFAAVLIHWRAFKTSDLIKSNQSNGAWVGLIAKLLFPRKKLITRCGWVRTSEMMTRHERLRGARRRAAKVVEWMCYRFSNAVIVTTPSDREFILGTYGIPRERVKVIPNTVDTRLFTPPADKAVLSDPVRLLAVGRLAHMKNFHNLILASGRLGRAVRLTLVGGGDYASELKRLAGEQPCEIDFVANVENSDLPGIYRAHDIFIMPQLYASGMSKVMIEAMACGLLTVGSDLKAHHEVIEHGVNGFLCGLDDGSIADCIRTIIETGPERLAAVSRRAREDAVHRYSLEANVDREFSLYASLVGVAPTAAPAPSTGQPGRGAGR